MTENKAPSSSELLEEIRRCIGEDQTYTARFEQLLRALAKSQSLADAEAAPAAHVTCEETQELLDLLVTDELLERELSRRHAQIMLHLLECQECRAAYSLLKESLTQKSDQQPAPETGQTARQQDEIGPSYLVPLVFRITRDFLRRALHGPQLTGVRGVSIEEGVRRTLLLHDIVNTPQGPLIVEVEMYQDLLRTAGFALHLQITNDWPLPENLCVNLSWGDLLRSAGVTDEGHAVFPDLPLQPLLGDEGEGLAEELAITFTICKGF